MSTIPIFWRDVLRWFEVVQALLLICVVVGVIIYYLLVTSTAEQRQLLRWHVVLVSLSYLGAITNMFVELLLRMNQPLSWRAWVATPILSIGLAAMIILVVHLTTAKRRFANHAGNSMAGDRPVEEWERRIRNVMMSVIQDEVPKLLATKSPV